MDEKVYRALKQNETIMKATADTEFWNMHIILKELVEEIDYLNQKISGLEDTVRYLED